MALLQKPVDCNCPAEFVIDILDTLPGSVQMAACTKCGRTDLADPICSEDRPHDVQFHGYSLLDLSAEAREWASAWPRYTVIDNARVYLPATAIFESTVERDAALAAASEQQQGKTLRDTLIALGIPLTEPPSSLPRALAGFVEIWNGLQLNDETPLDELLDAATRFNGPNRLAADILRRRPDLPDVTAALLWESGERRRSYGRYLVKQFRLTGYDVLTAIRSRLGWLDDNQTGEMGEICRLLRELGIEARPALPDLEAAAMRVQDTDYYMHKELTDLIKRWNDSPD